jgi:hypothetical protein
MLLILLSVSALFRLHEHFREHGFTPLMYSVEWFTTIFAISCSKDLVLRAYDLFLMEVSTPFPFHPWPSVSTQ